VIELVYVPNPTAQALTILLTESTLDYHGFSPGNETQGLYIPPLLLDKEPFEGGGQVEISHPGGAMVYLAEKARSEGRAGGFYPSDPKESFAAGQWVMWQSRRQAFRPGEADGADLNTRTNRLFTRINIWLDGRDYIAGSHYSIADMMCYPWVANWGGAEPEFRDFRNLQKWFYERVRPRDAVRNGMEAGNTRHAVHPLSRAISIMNFRLGDRDFAFIAADLAGDHTSRLP
jgi:GSH-dependent disulfide-bond oxidoreductase